MVASTSMSRLIQLAVCFAILFAVIANSLKFEDLEHGRGLKNRDDHEHDHKDGHEHGDKDEHEDKDEHAPEDENGQCGDMNRCFNTTDVESKRVKDPCECRNRCNSDEECHEWCWRRKGKRCYILYIHRDVTTMKGFYHGHHEDDHTDHDHDR